MVAALISPFAAVFVSLRASRKQATALIDSTKMQVRSAALRDARQRALEKLRDEFAAQIFDTIALSDAADVSPIDWDAVWLKVKDIEARKIRISLCVSNDSQGVVANWAVREDAVYRQLRDKLKNVKAGTFTEPQGDALHAAIDTLSGFAKSVLDSEEKRAARVE